MATMNVSLPDELKAWAETQATSGRYANVSDYVRDLIRRDQERSAKIAALQALITEGIESGVAEEFDFDRFLAEMRARFASAAE